MRRAPRWRCRTGRVTVDNVEDVLCAVNKRERSEINEIQIDTAAGIHSKKHNNSFKGRIVNYELKWRGASFDAQLCLCHSIIIRLLLLIIIIN